MVKDKRQGERRELAEAERLVRELSGALGVPIRQGKRPPEEPPLCSFCGAGRNNVSAMFCGKPEHAPAPVYICDDCIEAGYQMISNSNGS